jgi:hypothetical protein
MTKHDGDTPKHDPPKHESKAGPDASLTAIGIDYGGTGDYTFEEVPLPPAPEQQKVFGTPRMVEDNPPHECRTLHVVRQGRDFRHVDTDALGRWLYR